MKTVLRALGKINLASWSTLLSLWEFSVQFRSVNKLKWNKALIDCKFYQKLGIPFEAMNCRGLIKKPPLDNPQRILIKMKFNTFFRSKSRNQQVIPSVVILRETI